MLMSVFSTFKVQSFKISQRMIFRIKVHAWRALAELRNTTQHMGDIKQTELWLKYLFLLSVQHTLYHLLKLHSSRGSNQLACLQESCQTIPKQRSPENRTSSVSFALHTKSYGYPKRKLALLKKGVFIFSARRDYKKSVQAFSTKINTCREEKEVVIMALSQHTEILVEEIQAGTQIWVSVLQIILF